jgi:hypothetical protein
MACLCKFDSLDVQDKSQNDGQDTILILDSYKLPFPDMTSPSSPLGMPGCRRREPLAQLWTLEIGRGFLAEPRNKARPNPKQHR